MSTSCIRNTFTVCRLKLFQRQLSASVITVSPLVFSNNGVNPKAKACSVYWCREISPRMVQDSKQCSHEHGQIGKLELAIPASPENIIKYLQQLRCQTFQSLLLPSVRRTTGGSLTTMQRQYSISGFVLYSSYSNRHRHFGYKLFSNSDSRTLVSSYRIDAV